MSPLCRPQSGDHSRTTRVTCTPALASPRMVIRIERSTVRIPYSGERRANGKTSDAEAPVRSRSGGRLLPSAVQQSSLRSEPRIGMIIFRMRLIRILPLMASLSPAFADVGDVYIPQCDREHERCISRSFTAVLRPNVENPAKLAGPQLSTKLLGTPACQRASFLICAHLVERRNKEPHIDSGPRRKVT